MSALIYQGVRRSSVPRRHEYVNVLLPVLLRQRAFAQLTKRFGKKQ